MSRSNSAPDKSRVTPSGSTRVRLRRSSLQPVNQDLDCLLPGDRGKRRSSEHRADACQELGTDVAAALRVEFSVAGMEACSCAWAE